jgi:hypothetical protein
MMAKKDKNGIKRVNKEYNQEFHSPLQGKRARNKTIATYEQHFSAIEK